MATALYDTGLYDVDLYESLTGSTQFEEACTLVDSTIIVLSNDVMVWAVALTRG